MAKHNKKKFSGKEDMEKIQEETFQEEEASKEEFKAKKEFKKESKTAMDLYLAGKKNRKKIKDERQKAQLAKNQFMLNQINPTKNKEK